MYLGPHVKYPSFLSGYNETQIFTKHFQISNSRNPASESRVVPCREMARERDRQTDMTKLIVAFCSPANTPNKKTKIFKTYANDCIMLCCTNILTPFALLLHFSF